MSGNAAVGILAFFSPFTLASIAVSVSADSPFAWHNASTSLDSFWPRPVSATRINIAKDTEHKVMLKVKKLRPSAKIPQRATRGSTGLDLFACVDQPVQLGTNPQLIGTGIAIEVALGYDVQIRPRSGLSSKGIGVAFGSIDSDYRGEILVTMYLLAPGMSHEIGDGDRIAQMVVGQVLTPTVCEVEDITSTERGMGGHGSTGR